MVKGYGISKAQIFKDAYDLIIKEGCENDWMYDLRIAKTEQERFKVPVSM